ncbi:MAG: AraC-like DNA-binding protein [Rhodothermales bacterium]|jgi:AraC-like DNA-binding protein
MSTLNELSEAHMLGPETQFEAVRCGTDGERPWLSRAPLCEELSIHRIIHAGIMRARMPLKIARMQPSGTFFMATITGVGEVLVDGEWQRTGPEEGCLLPPHYPNAIRACNPGETWAFAWVRYLEPKSQIPVTTTNRPVIARCPASGLASAVHGVITASANQDNAVIMRHWVELIHGYVEQFAGPVQHDERLWAAWEAVQDRLGASWDLAAIAKRAFMSEEHFRRLCMRHLGRSPMKHLAFLRIQQAMRLLSETDDTVEAIGVSVGYQSAAAFAKAFRRWTGQRPSDLR